MCVIYYLTCKAFQVPTGDEYALWNFNVELYEAEYQRIGCMLPAYNFIWDKIDMGLI